MIERSWKRLLSNIFAAREITPWKFIDCFRSSLSVEISSNDNRRTLRPMSIVPHITVCICTYRREAMLLRLLDGIARQRTDRLFSISVVVADNDAAASARTVC